MADPKPRPSAFAGEPHGSPSDSLDSFLAAVLQLSKENKGKGGFYPDIYWKSLARYLRLVKRGAIFKVTGGVLCWDLPENQDALRSANKGLNNVE